MGAKQTKVEGSYLPSTPVSLSTQINNPMDPRSPDGCRTPIYLENKRTDQNVQCASVGAVGRNSNNENTLDVLRKRFLKSFTYNLNDPRSPTLNLDRTPLVFGDTLEKSLSLDDTFADLFVESNSHNIILNKVEKQKENFGDKYDQETDVEMPEEKVIIDLQEPKVGSLTPIGCQQQFDPRSPSVGVERTPIIFADEVDETNEDIVLEGILATLSLKLNTSGNSLVSMTTANANDINNKSELQGVTKPMNKHLDRVRVGKKCSGKPNPRNTKRRPSRQKIYEDQENHIPVTPKLKVSQGDKNDSLKGKRTPLSCVRNHNGIHARSRSVESSAKSIKTRLALTSFDDSVNINENLNVPNFFTSEGSQDSQEL